MEKLTRVIVKKLTEVAIEKGFNPNERGKLKELTRNYLQKTGYQSEKEKDKEKEFDKTYRSFYNFFTKEDKYSADTLDLVLSALDIENIFFEYKTRK